MHLIPFDCKEAEHSYRNFYSQTGAGSIPIFSGSKTQVGYGLGGIFGGLLKAVLPVLKKGAISVGKTALRSGISVARDGLEGKNIKTSLNKNIKAAGKDVFAKGLLGVGNLLNTQPTKKKHKRKRQSDPVVITQKKAKRKRHNPRARNRDIFER